MKERLIGVMVLSAVVSAAFTAVWVLFVSPRGTALAVGRVDVLLDFVFVDDESGQPIAGASLELQDPDYLEGPPKEPYSITRMSGPDGHARIHLPELKVTSVARRTADGQHWVTESRSLHYPNWECRVSAKGYRNTTISYDDWQSRYTANPRFNQTLVPPPIVLRLRRQDRPARSP